ncbi:hypothetical protein [Arthrobacter globiformis]|uniref:hypothetical protein n=1 Tax=Arthrobacter globiformis TaxID=1665 RepID=UPI000B40A89A|nr:hypothetical protein [Arthrobacter globiformis]
MSDRVRLSLTFDVEVDKAVLQTSALGVPSVTDEGKEFDAPMSATSDPVVAAQVWAVGLHNAIIDMLPGSVVQRGDVDVTNVD